MVWKRVYFKPAAANFSAFGVWQGPPKALDDPHPASSMRMIRTLGAPSGGAEIPDRRELGLGIFRIVANETGSLSVANRQMRAVRFSLIAHGTSPRLSGGSVVSALPSASTNVGTMDPTHNRTLGLCGPPQPQSGDVTCATNNVVARERRTWEDLAVASTTGRGHCAARTKVRLPSPGLSSD